MQITGLDSINALFIINVIISIVTTSSQKLEQHVILLNIILKVWQEKDFSKYVHLT